MHQNIVEVDLKQLDGVVMNEEQKILMIDVSEVANEQNNTMKLDSRVRIVKEVPDQDNMKRVNMFEVYCNKLIQKNN